MSAPPIGMINSTPNSNAAPINTANATVESGSTTSQIAAMTDVISVPMLTKFRPGYTIGRVETISCSLPNAIRLPVNVKKPSSISSASAPNT
jgi:hypothetical protein